MPDAQNQAERYRHVAEEYRRLTATSSSTRNARPLIGGWQSITARWLRPPPRRRAYKDTRTASSHFDRSDLTDGVLAHAAYR